MNNKITLSVFIQGGLGNQLWQIFTLLNLSKKQGTNYVIQKLKISPSCTYRITYWDKLFENLNLVENYDFNNFENYNSKTNWESPENFPILEKNTMIHGYFQNLENVNEFENEIFNYIKLSDDDTKILNSKIDYLRSFNKKLIFIHIRRGDYVNLGNTLDFEKYYKPNIEKLNSNDTLFVVFSDDLDYCKQKLNYLENKVYIELEDYISLILMSYMDGAIIANSSFSWWGAYLMKIKNKDAIFIKPDNYLPDIK